MSLTTGTYTIRSAAFSNPYVGRSPIEDLSLLPKRILSLPNDQKTPTWDIQELGGGQYYLKANGNPTAIINDLVYAILLNFPAAEPWGLEQVPQHGGDQYLILSNSSNTGWVLPSPSKFTQVAVSPLISTASIPPQYPPNERWIIESLGDLD